MIKLKIGREVLDPLNCVVTIVEIGLEFVTVRLAGSYHATIRYPASCLRPVP
jgi:hypothetical protein